MIRAISQRLALSLLLFGSAFLVACGSSSEDERQTATTTFETAARAGASVRDALDQGLRDAIDRLERLEGEAKRVSVLRDVQQALREEG
jgi:hypothetical protein